jgi:hypothetical protein
MIQLHTIIQFLLSCYSMQHSRSCESSSRSAGQNILVHETGSLSDVFTKAITAHHASQLKHIHSLTIYFLSEPILFHLEINSV